MNTEFPFEGVMTEKVKSEISRTSKAAYAFLLEMIAIGKVTVIPDSEVAKVEWRLCSDTKGTETAIAANCSQCGNIVYIDPGHPDGPKLICMPCALGQAKGEQSLTE